MGPAEHLVEGPNAFDYPNTLVCHGFDRGDDPVQVSCEAATGV